ncbi:MAG TPA: EAL domain-containing protein [Gaiellaceae bacterium]|nr:EAL domain-containing protein [Gaiellaceae bacterium]
MTAATHAGSLAALGQRPPRLVLRVVVYSALTLGIGAATLLVFLRQFERGRAEHAAMLEASVVTQTVVDRLVPGDLRGASEPARRRQLDRLFRARVLDGETLAAAIARPDGRLVYATGPSLAGQRLASAEKLRAALRGTVESEQVAVPSADGGAKVLRTYAPFRLAGGATGVFVVDRRYAPIASAAKRAAIAVAAVLELALLALWLCLIPIMRTVTRRINRQLETIAHLALHDELTGSPNRTEFGSRLDEVLQREGRGRCAVLFIDLDRFKDVNDTLGHERGNELLRLVAGRIRDALGPRERMARLGGDEFAVLSETAVEPESAVALAQRVRASVAEPCEIAGMSIELRASVGIALAPRHGTTRDELLRRADIAMYAAKQDGPPRVFTEELDDRSPVRLAVTGELRRALERRELVVFFQPQVDLRTGAVRGVEALVRWQHPVRGLLGPHEFLTAVEHAGLSRTLTRYVLDESLRQLRGWKEEGRDLGLAVNVSARDLADARFPAEVAEALARHGVDPAALELEVTEDVLMSDGVRGGRRLEQLVEHGVRVAIDDFGVGYSSLGQLRSLPAQVLKIDRSFVARMGTSASDAAIVRSIIGLAHQLGLDVVAEGVESPAHVAWLREAGCDAAQGFLLGRPQPHGAGLTAAAQDMVVAQAIPLRRAFA